MPRLPITLDDYWTRRRLTRVEVANGALSGCGIGLDVWQHLFDFRDGSWYATVHGGFHDNLTLLSLDLGHREEVTSEPFVLSEAAREPKNVSPLLATLPLRVLSPEILQICGVPTLEDVTAGGPILASLYLHDDFIFAITRTTPGVISDALRLIVRVHQHYLAMDLTPIQEHEVTDRVLGILEREGSVDLQSLPGDPSIRITYKRSRTDWLSRLFKLRRRFHEVIALPPRG